MSTIVCPKCEAEHEPIGNSEDAGETICDECGFAFFVEIEYDPVYSTQCVDHEFGLWDDRSRLRFCVNCMYCECRDEASET